MTPSATFSSQLFWWGDCSVIMNIISGVLKKKNPNRDSRGKKSRKTYQLGSAMEHRRRNAPWATPFYTTVNNAVRNKLNL